MSKTTGGKTADGTRLNDVYVLDVENWSWTCVYSPPLLAAGGSSDDNATIPNNTDTLMMIPSFAFHSATLGTSGLLHILGGTVFEHSMPISHLIYNLNTMSWDDPLLVYAASDGVASDKLFHHDIPGERHSHTAVVDRSKEIVYMFGGVLAVDGGTPLGDFHQLDLKTGQWSPVNVEATEGDDHGGAPAPRYKHGSVYLHDADWIIVIGGYNKSALNDVYGFDIACRLWRPLISDEAEAMKVPHMEGHTVTYVESMQQVFVMGGVNSIFDCISFDEIPVLKVSMLASMSLRDEDRVSADAVEVLREGTTNVVEVDDDLLSMDRTTSSTTSTSAMPPVSTFEDYLASRGSTRSINSSTSTSSHSSTLRSTTSSIGSKGVAVFVNSDGSADKVKSKNTSDEENALSLSYETEEKGKFVVGKLILCIYILGFIGFSKLLL